MRKTNISLFCFRTEIFYNNSLRERKLNAFILYYHFHTKIKLYIHIYTSISVPVYMTEYTRHEIRSLNKTKQSKRNQRSDTFHLT